MRVCVKERKLPGLKNSMSSGTTRYKMTYSSELIRDSFPPDIRIFAGGWYLRSATVFPLSAIRGVYTAWCSVEIIFIILYARRRPLLYNTLNDTVVFLTRWNILFRSSLEQYVWCRYSHSRPTYVDPIYFCCLYA